MAVCSSKAKVEGRARHSTACCTSPLACRSILQRIPFQGAYMLSKGVLDIGAAELRRYLPLPLPTHSVSSGAGMGVNSGDEQDVQVKSSVLQDFFQPTEEPIGLQASLRSWVQFACDCDAPHALQVVGLGGGFALNLASVEAIPQPPSPQVNPDQLLRLSR